MSVRCLFTSADPVINKVEAPTGPVFQGGLTERLCYSVKEASEATGLSTKTIRALLKSKRLPGTQVAVGVPVVIGSSLRTASWHSFSGNERVA